MKKKFITALGLPGCGKSSTMRELAKLYDTPYLYCEPEEDKWGMAVMNREECGYFSGLMWFRSERVAMLYEAEKKFKEGNIVITDSYYDKAINYYLGKSGMEWLLSPNDQYFNVAKEITSIDWKILPNVTDIITFELDEKTWKQFLKKRNRDLDNNAQLLESFSTQKYFVEAAEKLCTEFNINHIRFKQCYSNPIESAKKIFELIERRE